MLESAAQSYLAAGLSVLPARRAEKRPAIGRWKAYQSRRPTDAERLAWMANGPDGLCIICGAISGNLEIIDFDSGGELFDAWRQKIPPDLYSRLVIETTPSGGYHVIYRCTSEVFGNLKLAQRKTDTGIQTLIETRGEGGLFLCAPTPGYECIQGELSDIPTLFQEQRLQLLEAAWALNEYIQPVPASNAAILQSYSDRPGDAFNQHGDVRAVLQKHGWLKTHEDSVNEYYRRPGKTSGHSASLRKEDRTFVNFSSNAPFEPYKGYSPFHVLAVLDHRGDFTQAAQALVHMGYGGHTTSHGGECADLSGIMAQCAESREESAETPVVADPGPLLEHLFDVPGLIREIMDFSLANAPHPNLGLAFCGALSMQSYLCGRKVCFEGSLRPNMYLLALAPSGTGKDYPRKVNAHIMLEIGKIHALGDKFASGQGLADAMYRHGAMLFQNDEMDGVLRQINADRENKHESIPMVLLTMYTSADSTYPMRAKAGKEESGFIDQPHLTLFGTATPTHFYQSLSSRMLTNGLFARMMVIDIGQRSRGQRAGAMRNIPDSILQTARWWSEYQPGSRCGNLRELHPEPREVRVASNAQEAIEGLRVQADDEYDAAHGRDDEVGRIAWSRFFENAMKLALLRACSINHEDPLVDVPAIEWARQFALHQTQRQLFMAQSYVADSQFDEECLRLLRKLRESPQRQIPHHTLLKKMKMKAKEFRELMDTLIQRGDVEVVTKTQSQAGRPSNQYKLAEEKV